MHCTGLPAVPDNVVYKCVQYIVLFVMCYPVDTYRVHLNSLPGYDSTAEGIVEGPWHDKSRSWFDKSVSEFTDLSSFELRQQSDFP